MVGLKRKIPIEKIKDKNSRSVAFSKRRNGLYRKAVELCQRFGSQIAILIASPSSQRSNVFYSFGHSSVDAVVEAFLENRSLATKSVSNSSVISLDRVIEALKVERETNAGNKRKRDCLQFKKKELGFLGDDDTGKKKNHGYLQCKKKKQDREFWWENDEFEMYEDVDELTNVIERIERLQINLKSRSNDLRNNYFSNETENLGSSSSGGVGDFTQWGYGKPQNISSIVSSNDVLMVRKREVNKEDISEVSHGDPTENPGSGQSVIDELECGEMDFNIDFDLDCFNEPQPEIDSSVHLDFGSKDRAQADSIADSIEAYIISAKSFSLESLELDEADIGEGQTSSGYQKLFREFASCLN